MVVLAEAGASLNFMWRFALGFGAVVPMISLFFRAQMHESKVFRELKEQNSASSTATTAMLATLWRYRFHIAGTALNWFIFDIMFYGNSMFNQDMTQSLHVGEGLKGKMYKTLIIVLIQLP